MRYLSSEASWMHLEIFSGLHQQLPGYIQEAIWGVEKPHKH